MYIVFAILMLAVLIVVHEFGHFMAARLMKIDVTEFSVGFGPRLLGWKSRKYETKFSIRAIPLGGYCAFFGEDDAKGITKDDPRAFPNHSVWKRMFVILMGPMMNFVLAFVVTLVFVWCAGIYGNYPYILESTEGSAAYEAGIQPDDLVTKIDGEDAWNLTREDAENALRNAIREGKEIRLTVLRGEETADVFVTPRLDDESGEMRIGITYTMVQLDGRKRVGFAEGFHVAWYVCVDSAGQILKLLGELPTNKEVLEQTTGVVGTIAEVSHLTQEYGIEMFINLLVVISINLGLMNLLPIPGLDGSRLVFGLIEIIRGKPIPPEKEAIVHLAGMVLLFGIMIFFTYKDIARLIR